MEDVNRSECHLRESPNAHIPTSHTVGRAIKELARENIEYKSSPLSLKIALLKSIDRF